MGDYPLGEVGRFDDGSAGNLGTPRKVVLLQVGVRGRIGFRDYWDLGDVAFPALIDICEVLAEEAADNVLSDDYGWPCLVV